MFWRCDAAKAARGSSPSPPVEKHRKSGAFLRFVAERFERERPSIYYLAKRGRGKADKIKL